MARGGGGPVQVELRLAGSFAVFRDGSELQDGEVGSRKARLLLKLLAVQRPAVVSVDRIVDVLWPGEPPAAARQNVATLVSRLRAVFGPGLVLGGRGGYRLAPWPSVEVDLDTATELCDQAESKLSAAAGLALAAAEKAVSLMSAGEALADEPDAVWAEGVRHELRALLRRAQFLAAQAALAAGVPQRAVRHTRAAVAVDPLDEAAHRWYMSALVAVGEPAKALAAYAALAERLAEELGTDPAPQTQQLHLEILREQDGNHAMLGAPASQPQPGNAARQTLLAGRESELAALHQAWAGAGGGQPSLQLIVGEAGIGKTTLAEALVAEAQRDGATVLRSRCYEAERSLFLQPVLDAIAGVMMAMPARSGRRLLGDHAAALASLLPGATELLGGGPAGRGSADIERRRVFDAVTTLLSRLALASPVLLFIDDLHCGSQSTVEFLHYLRRHTPRSRLLTIATVRAENEAAPAAALSEVAVRIELGPLTEAAVGELARKAGQGELAASIMERTHGHALFVVEVLGALAAGDAGIPESLRNAVLARVRRAGAPAETLLRAASVLGSALDPLLLSRLLDLPPGTAMELCAAAMDARLVVVSGRDYEFANDLIREVLYESTPEPTRIAYHRRAADLLADLPEVLARHAAAADDWPRAARAWTLAGENAMRRYAASDAVALATQALSAAERASDLEIAARALLVRARAWLATGAQDAALADLKAGQATARAAGDRRLEMLALLGIDHLPSRGQPVAHYAANLESGLKIAESLGDRITEARLLSQLAVVAANRLRLDDALSYSLRAEAAGRASGDLEALASALDAVKTARLYLGDVTGLRAVLEELEPIVRKLGDLWRLQWAEFESAFVAVAAADWDQATTAIHAAIVTNQRGGYPHCKGWYTAHLSWIARLRGRDAEAVKLGHEALEASRRHEHTSFLAAARAMLGRALMLTTDRTSAIAQFEAGLAAAEVIGSEAYLLRCAAPLAVATGSVELLARASALLEQAGVPEGGAWMLDYESYLEIASAWLEQGEPGRARATLAPMLAVAEREPWIGALAAALAVDGKALSRLGEPVMARLELEQASRLAKAHGLTHVLCEASSTLDELG